MTRLFRLPVTSVLPKARALHSTALVLTLALGGLGTGQIALAQDTTQAPAATADQASTSPDQAPSGQTAPTTAPADQAPANPDAAAPAPTNTGDSAMSVPATPVSEPATPKENPYGLKALWSNGDIIARSVLLIMAIMSAGSWIIIVMKFIEQARIFRASRDAATSFWAQDSVQDGTKSLKSDSPFRYIAETGVMAAQHHEGSMRDSIDLQSWVASSIQRSVEMINSRLQGGLAFLGTVGSTSPFIGLFGTVWGIYHALTAIGIAGQASIDKVAGPVGESLIMTAIGLATAVPAVLGYNLLVRRNKAAMDRVRNFASDIHSVLLGGYRHDATFSDVNSDRSPPTTITTSQRV